MDYVLSAWLVHGNCVRKVSHHDKSDFTNKVPSVVRGPTLEKGKCKSWEGHTAGSLASGIYNKVMSVLPPHLSSPPSSLHHFKN